MHVDEDDLGAGFLHELIRHAKGIVVRSHEDAALQIDHGVWDAILAAFVEAVSG